MYKLHSHANLLEQNGQRHVQYAPQAFIDVDVEADGVAGHGSLLSIGAVSPWGDEFYTELRPINSEYIPANREFCEQHGLTRERLLDEGQDPCQALLDFTDWTERIVLTNAKQSAVLPA